MCSRGHSAGFRSGQGWLLRCCLCVRLGAWPWHALCAQNAHSLPASHGCAPSLACPLHTPCSALWTSCTRTTSAGCPLSTLASRQGWAGHGLMAALPALGKGVAVPAPAAMRTTCPVALPHACCLLLPQAAHACWPQQQCPVRHVPVPPPPCASASFAMCQFPVRHVHPPPCHCRRWTQAMRLTMRAPRRTSG